MTANEVVAELRALATESTRRTWLRHGAKEPIFGVKIGDMKEIQKRIKTDHALALDLYATGIGDAQYFAGLIADDQQMSKKDLQRWLDTAAWSMVSDYTVPWVAAGSKHGRDMALKWMGSKKDHVSAAGWATYSSVVATHEDEDLDLAEISELVKRVARSIHDAPNKTRYMMNGFVIAVGCYVAPLTKEALAAGKAIGPVTVDMGDTDCTVPSIVAYIGRAQAKKAIGKKRMSAKC